jgi:hypothetical protein
MLITNKMILNVFNNTMLYIWVVKEIIICPLTTVHVYNMYLEFAFTILHNIHMYMHRNWKGIFVMLIIYYMYKNS